MTGPHKLPLSKKCLVLLLSVLLMAACAPSAPSTSTVTMTPRPINLGATLIQKRAYPSLSYGIQAFLWWNNIIRARDLELIRQMRFDYVKQIFGWADIQPDPKVPYNWQQADAVVNEVQYRQLKLIVRLSGAPVWAVLQDKATEGNAPFDVKAFGQYCGDLAARYKGKIAGYEVWNEPNLGREWANHRPDAAGYVQLLAACYTAIKTADPSAIVISAGLAPTGGDGNPDDATPDEQYLNEMYQAGAAAYFDVLGLHAPGYKWSPDKSPDDPELNGNRWMAFRHVEDMRTTMVAYGDGSKQVAILEMGWTTDPRQDSPYHWHAVSEQQQAEYLVDAYRYAALHWRPWVGLMMTIYLPDPGWTEKDEEYWWAIMTPGNIPYLRPAYFDLADMERYMDDVVLPTRDPGKPDYKPLPPPTP